MSGVFDLKTAADLRQKLRRDLERLKENFQDAEAAFNFFVTAEHMLDWVYPGDANRAKRTETRKNSLLLQVCSHLANGAKHFEVERPHHGSVESTGNDRASGYFGNYFGPSYFGGGSKLVVRLRGDAATEFGQTVGAIKLATMIMEYWDKHPLS